MECLSSKYEALEGRGRREGGRKEGRKREIKSFQRHSRV
jgi:hypothetical protein